MRSTYSPLLSVLFTRKTCTNPPLYNDWKTSPMTRWTSPVVGQGGKYPLVHRPVNYQKVTVRPPSGRCARQSLDMGISMYAPSKSYEALQHKHFLTGSSGSSGKIAAWTPQIPPKVVAWPTEKACRKTKKIVVWLGVGPKSCSPRGGWSFGKPVLGVHTGTCCDGEINI